MFLSLALCTTVSSKYKGHFLPLSLRSWRSVAVKLVPGRRRWRQSRERAVRGGRSLRPTRTCSAREPLDYTQWVFDIMHAYMYIRPQFKVSHISARDNEWLKTSVHVHWCTCTCKACGDTPSDPMYMYMCMACRYMYRVTLGPWSCKHWTIQLHVHVSTHMYMYTICHSSLYL